LNATCVMPTSELRFKQMLDVNLFYPVVQRWVNAAVLPVLHCRGQASS
jgi:hypothetical protein